jgi:hypothetical protein
MEEKTVQILNEIKKELEGVRRTLDRKEIEYYKHVPPKMELSEIQKPSLARSFENSKGFFILTLWIGVLIQVMIKVFS